MLLEVGGLDKDDESDEEVVDKGKGKEKEASGGEDEEESDSDDSDDDEDETAELLRELEKIKRERAEEKERIVSSFEHGMALKPDSLTLSLSNVGSRESSQ